MVRVFLCSFGRAGGAGGACGGAAREALHGDRDHLDRLHRIVVLRANLAIIDAM